MSASAETVQQQPQHATVPPLWHDCKIPIILFSGEVNSGKTIAALTIDPNCRVAGTPPTTICWDQEGSASSYEGSLNFNWRDIRAATAEGVHLKTHRSNATDPKWRKIILERADVNDSPSASMFRAWYLDLLAIERGQYRVGICDTFTPLQDGLVEWLRQHPEAFGRTSAQYDKAASMFLWPDVKAVLSYILATDCRLRFETFVMNVHLKNEWQHGGKTGNRIAEGLDVLSKLATLHIELDRTPPAKCKEAPRVPSGIVRKERLIRFGQTPDEDLPILPPRLERATPDAIRQYILNPPDFAKLKPGERMTEQSLSDDDKLLIQADIARNNAEAAQAELSRVDRMKAAAAAVMQARGVGSVAAAVQDAADAVTESAEAAIDHAQSVKAEMATEVNHQVQSASVSLATDGQLAEIKQRWSEVWKTPLEFSGFLKEKFGVARPKELSEQQATELILMVCEHANSVQTGSADAAKTVTPTATEVATKPVESPELNGSEATREQLNEIQRLAKSQTPDGKDLWNREQQEKWLKTRGVMSFRSISQSDADGLIERLSAAAQGFAVQQGTPGN